jgi:hypothetical protein
MLWPALRALAHGHMENDQLSWLLNNLGLTKSVRTEGPGAAQSIAHRAFTDQEVFSAYGRATWRGRQYAWSVGINFGGGGHYS